MMFLTFHAVDVEFDLKKYKEDLKEDYKIKREEKLINKNRNLIYFICSGIGIASVSAIITLYASKKISLKTSLLTISLTAGLFEYLRRSVKYNDPAHKSILYPYYKIVFDALYDYCSIFDRNDKPDYEQTFNFLKQLGFSEDEDKNKELEIVLFDIIKNIHNFSYFKQKFSLFLTKKIEKWREEPLINQYGIFFRIISFKYISKRFFKQYEFLKSFFKNESFKLIDLHKDYIRNMGVYLSLFTYIRWLRDIPGDNYPHNFTPEQYKNLLLSNKDSSFLCIENHIKHNEYFPSKNQIKHWVSKRKFFVHQYPFFLENIVIPKGRIGMFCKNFLQNIWNNDGSSCTYDWESGRDNIKKSISYGLRTQEARLLPHYDTFPNFVKNFLNLYKAKQFTKEEFISMLGVYLYVYIDDNNSAWNCILSTFFRNSNDYKKFVCIIDRYFKSIGGENTLPVDKITDLEEPVWFYSLTQRVCQFLFASYLKSYSCYTDNIMEIFKNILKKNHITNIKFFYYLEEMQGKMLPLKKNVCIVTVLNQLNYTFKNEIDRRLLKCDLFLDI